MKQPVSFFVDIFRQDYPAEIVEAFSGMFPDPTVKISHTEAVNKIDQACLGDSKPRKFKAAPCNTRRFRFKLPLSRARK
ncbi:MAG: hypothetical protein WC250_02315 [Candidatus Paceibacterota bacterium]